MKRNCSNRGKGDKTRAKGGKILRSIGWRVFQGKKKEKNLRFLSDYVGCQKGRWRKERQKGGIRRHSHEICYRRGDSERGGWILKDSVTKDEQEALQIGGKRGISVGGGRGGTLGTLFGDHPG